MLVDIVVAVFLERTTPKTSRNSGLPSSRDGTDDGQTHTEGKSGSRSRGPKARHARSDTPAHGHHDAHQRGHRVPAVRTRT